MNLSTKKRALNVLKKYRVYPSKRLGQNFLIARGVLRKIVKAANLRSDDTILEIGPGIGNLTQELSQKAGKVISVEKDPRMIEILKETTKNLKNVKIIQGDILKLDAKHYNLKPKAYKVVANLPYYIVSPVIRKFLEMKNPPKLMVLMVQKEVAQRICAKPPDMSLLSVSVQFYAKPEVISFVSKKSFWPSPKVDSAILKIIPRKSAYSISVDQLLFFKIVRAGFSQPRKQLINNLSQGLKNNKERVMVWLLKNKIRPNQRAETLSIQDWLNLAKTFPFA